MSVPIPRPAPVINNTFSPLVTLIRFLLLLQAYTRNHDREVQRGGMGGGGIGGMAWGM